MTRILSSVTPTIFPASTPAGEMNALLAQRQGVSHKVGALKIDSIRALLIELSSLEFKAIWTIDSHGEIHGNQDTSRADRQFPGMITVLSRIALIPAGEMLAQCRSLQQWVFGWRTSESLIIVAEANFRSERSDMSESDMASMRSLVDSSLRVNQSTVVVTHAPAPAEHPDTPIESKPEPTPPTAVKTLEPAHTKSEAAPATHNLLSPVFSTFQAPSSLSGAPAVNITKTDEPPAPRERKYLGPGSTRKTITIPVGQRRETPREEVLKPLESSLAEADTLIAISESETRTTGGTETPGALSPTQSNIDPQPARQSASTAEKEEEGEFPRAYSETVTWPQIKPSAAKHPPLVSTLGLTLAIICTLLSLWVASVAVPETLASYQADAQRRRTMSDQTMVRDLSMAMASGDYGDVQAALSSFASMGYFESALVSNARKRIVAQAGLDTGIRIGDETPPDVKKFARALDLRSSNESQGQLLLLHEGNNEEQQNGLISIQIGAIVVGVASFLFSLLIALRLYRAPLARLLLRNR